jgi:hypothetical protein
LPSPKGRVLEPAWSPFLNNWGLLKCEN